MVTDTNSTNDNKEVVIPRLKVDKDLIHEFINSTIKFEQQRLVDFSETGSITRHSFDSVTHIGNDLTLGTTTKYVNEEKRVSNYLLSSTHSTIKKFINEDAYSDNPPLIIDFYDTEVCAVMRIDHIGFLVKSDLNIEELLNESIYQSDKLKKALVYFFNSCQTVRDLTEYRDELTEAGGQGYYNSIQEDIDKISQGMREFFDQLLDYGWDSWYSSYFDYGKSKIEDLSVMNNVHCYSWVVDSHTASLFDYVYAKAILSGLGTDEECKKYYPQIFNYTQRLKSYVTKTSVA